MFAPSAGRHVITSWKYDRLVKSCFRAGLKIEEKAFFPKSLEVVKRIKWKE
jgi:hypothetical protein